jgi:hypothetical protein
VSVDEKLIVRLVEVGSVTIAGLWLAMVYPVTHTLVVLSRSVNVWVLAAWPKV